jgi:hypothetical protein
MEKHRRKKKEGTCNDSYLKDRNQKPMSSARPSLHHYKIKKDNYKSVSLNTQGSVSQWKF